MQVELRRQLSVAIENEPGRLAAVARLLAARAIAIDAFTLIDNVEHGMVRLLCAAPDEAKVAIRAAGFPVVEAAVLAVDMRDRVGNLAAIGDALAAGKVNIEYAYASASAPGLPTRLILKTGNPERARDILAALPDAL